MPWTRHASGTLASGGTGMAGEQEAADLAAWPPEGTVPVAAADVYGQLAAAGYEYGPAFRGLHAAWLGEDEVYAEVRLPGGRAAAGEFLLHPALLDAALHAIGALVRDPAGGPVLPFAWSGVSLSAAGAAALRVRLRKTGDGTVSLAAADETGTPVVSATSLALRPVAAGQLGAAGHVTREALFTPEWVPVAVPAAAGPAAGGWAIAGADSFGLAAGLAAATPVRVHAGLDALGAAVTAGDPVPDVVLACAEGPDGADHADMAAAARAVTGQVLRLVQQWLADDRLATARLVVVTRGAVAVEPGEHVSDLAAASARGLVRSAQSEHPGPAGARRPRPGRDRRDAGDGAARRRARAGHQGGKLLRQAAGPGQVRRPARPARRCRPVAVAP